MGDRWRLAWTHTTCYKHLELVLFIYLLLFHESAVATAATEHYFVECCCHLVVTFYNYVL